MKIVDVLTGVYGVQNVSVTFAVNYRFDEFARAITPLETFLIGVEQGAMIERVVVIRTAIARNQIDSLPVLCRHV